MAYIVNFKEGEVETVGLESSPVAEALAGLRANEARYLWNKYKFEYVTYAVEEKPEVLEFVTHVLKERDIEVQSKALQVALFDTEEWYWPMVYYESGLAINVAYEKHGEKPKRAVGLKLAVGMEIPTELEGKFKFVRQKSRLAGEIRGSYFIVKGNYDDLIPS